MNEIPEACRTMADSVSNQAMCLSAMFLSPSLPSDPARCRFQFWVDPLYNTEPIRTTACSKKNQIKTFHL